MTLRPSRPPLADAILAPVLVFAATEIVALLGAWRLGYPALRASTWARWDSGHYLAIAAHGYDTAECVPRSCGSSGWFPGISALTWGLGRLGLPLGGAMLLLSRAFALGTLVLVWNGLLGRSRRTASLAALVFAGFVPGAVYHHALFPMSAAAFCMLGTLLLVHRERWGLAAVAAAVAATMYPIAAVLAPVVALWVLLDRREPPAPSRPPRRRVQLAAIVSLGVAAGGVAVLVAQRVGTGTWSAYRYTVDQFPLERAFPLVAWYRYVDDLWTETGTQLIAFQALFTGLVIAVVVGSEVQKRARGLPLLLVIFTVAAWLFPLALSQFSLFRADSLLVPVAGLIARLPDRVAVVLASVAVVLMWAMLDPFLSAQLV